MEINSLKYDTIDSTNEEAKRLIRKGIISTPTLISAKLQTNGKGTKGRFWHAIEGQNSTVSLVVQNVSSSIVPLSIRVGFAVKELLNVFGIDSKIKFPNDIYVNSKKISGILIEKGKWGSKISFYIIGVGLNANQIEFPGEVPNATSIILESGNRIEVDELNHLLANAILNEVSSRINSIETYNHSFLHLGKEMQVLDTQNQSLCIGTFLGLNSNGYLVIQNNDDEMEIAPEKISTLRYV